MLVDDHQRVGVDVEDPLRQRRRLLAVQGEVVGAGCVAVQDVEDFVDGFDPCADRFAQLGGRGRGWCQPEDPAAAGVPGVGEHGHRGGLARSRRRVGGAYSQIRGGETLDYADLPGIERAFGIPGVVAVHGRGDEIGSELTCAGLQ